MTLIEAREALEPRILSNKKLSQQELATSGTFVDESGSDDEFLIADEGYPEDEEENNNYRDFFSLPTLGLNYFNNLNLSLNLNLNLRNSPLWRIYENTSFTKPGKFLSTYLGKHTDEDGLDTINEHDIGPDARGYFTITNFLRRHGFPTYDEDCYSEEAILERVRFKKLQQQSAAAARARLLSTGGNKCISSFEVPKLEKRENTCILKENSLLESEKKLEVTDEQIEKGSEIIVHQSSVNDLNGEERSELANRLHCDKAVNNDLQHEKEMDRNANVYPKVLNPFYNRVEQSWWDKVKIGVFSCTILPIKVVFMALILLVALLLSMIGTYGVSFEASQSRPLSKWRRLIRWILANIVMRSFVFCSGFVWSIKETGKRATPEEAPIFVVGPHSSYFDAFAVILLGAPSVVAKLSTKDIPVFGRLVTLTQAVYVSRESKGSRRQTMEVLKQRAQGVYNGSGMPQIFIFPEGTCSNRSSLIRFKPGAFVPQVPVQPVLIRYPNKFDACTWTFDGPPTARNIWYALAQFYNKIEIEYLPVYTPNQAEKNDPALFAENVRKVMAKALNVPISDYQYEDGTLLCTMRESNLVQKLRSIHRAKRALGLWGSTRECTLILEGIQHGAGENYYKMGFYDFQREFFHVSSEDTTVPEVQSVFNCFKNDGNDEEELIDIRPYLVLACILYEDRMLSIKDIPMKVCQMYGLAEEEITVKSIEASVERVFQLSASEGVESSPRQSQSNLGTNETTREMEVRTSRIIDFAKLFADEVTERLPKTYPSREERDKIPIPSRINKIKSD